MFVIFIYLKSEGLINITLIPQLCIFEYLLNIAVVSCLVLPNILRSLLAKFVSDSYAGILEKTSDKKKVTTF